MYQVFLDKLGLPIPPSSIETTINNRNETVDLIDGSQINVLKKAGLTDITFGFLIPSTNYPFVSLLGSLAGVAVDGMGVNGYAAVKQAMLTYLEKLKTEKKSFQFIVARLGNRGSVVSTYNSNMKVSLESYTIKEDAENYGFDFYVEVNLKQYIPYSTKRLSDDGKIVKVRT